MNKKLKCLTLFLLITGEVIAKEVPLEIKDELYGLTNYWGKGESLQEYHEARQKCLDQLEGYDDWKTVEEEWTAFFLRYLVNNAPFDGNWMSESGEEMLFAGFAGSTRYSTNCWFIAAEYAKKLTKLEKSAKLEFDRLWEAESFDTPETNQILRINAWNRLVNTEDALGQSMRATTNVFPRWILPELSAPEGAALYTNVLRRAGLVK